MFKISKRSIIVVILVVLSSLGLSAEEKKYGGGMGFFSAGWQTLDIASLNKTLSSNNFPEFSESGYMFGGGGYGIIGNFIIGGEGYGLNSEKKSNNLYKTSVSGGYGLFNIGYVLLRMEGLIIYPMIGIGGGGLNVTISEKGGYDFNEIMNNPKRGIELSNGGFITSLSLGADYLLSFSKDEENKGGLMLGVRGGFILPMYKGSNWTYAEQDITNGPDANIKGFFIRLSIGGGGISSGKAEKKSE